jgi:drug/metabolite transporter (DMT)-like permease
MPADELKTEERELYALQATEQASTDDMQQVGPATLTRWQRLRLDALLIFVTMIWGSTFLVTQLTVRLVGPFTYLALIFGIGSLTLALIFRKRLRHMRRADLLAGGLIGLFLFAGYALQTHGLQYTTTSKAGFITGLYVPLVPVLSFIFLRQKPSVGAVIGIALSVLGLVLLSLNNQFNFTFGPGEALMLGCAFAFAMHIVCISKFAPRADAINLAIVQLGLTSLLCFVAMPLAGEPFKLPPLIVWIVVVLMGLGDIAFCLAVMNSAQRYISSTRATLVYALEPAWAGLFGYLAGQGLSLPAWIGCACIFLGMIVGGVRWRSLISRRRGILANER